MGRNVKYLNCTKIIYGTLSLIISYTLHTKESKIPSNIFFKKCCDVIGNISIFIFLSDYR